MASLKPRATVRAGGEGNGRERVFTRRHSWAPTSLPSQNAGPEIGFEMVAQRFEMAQLRDGTTSRCHNEAKWRSSWLTTRKTLR
ncbi:MAG TPA: hypothetical protein VNY05_18490 [Candidatus Acidoferrales bacterium]|nr:hypothetical protein [Candidatus Acidoferrales bacterium]